MLDAASAAEFELAVDQQYWYELILDDLPMWGMVGEVLRDEQHGKMEKVTVCIDSEVFELILGLSWFM